MSASEQTAGRGRQGRTWSAPSDSSLLCSLVLRDPPGLLSLIAGVAVCDAVGERARVKWPNDVVIEQRRGGADAVGGSPFFKRGRPSETGPGRPPTLAKLAGILVEGRPQEDWAVLGIGVNVALRVEELPAEVRASAASLDLPQSAIEPLLIDLLGALARRLAQPVDALLETWRERDALLGRDVSWTTPAPAASGGRDARHPLPGERPSRQGRAEGIDSAGRLLVREAGSHEPVALNAGEVHLATRTG